MLYGLILSAGRRVNFGRIDPQAARRIFVREALVHGRCQLSAAFLVHSRQVRATLERDEAKLRRHGALFDEDRAAAFLLDRIPERVHDLRGFERWRRAAEESDPRQLMNSIEDVVAAGSTRPGARFPDALDVGGRKLTLDYRFDPDAADDGATADLPIAMLGSLNAGRLAWGVPGWRQELLATMIRGLPKALRRTLVPAPATAAACLAEVDVAAPMHDEVARWLSRHAGIVIPADALRSVELPGYLKVNLRVTGTDGRELAQGRDLALLRSQLQGVSAAALSHSTREFSRSGIREWDIDRLAKSMEVDRDGLQLMVYPALSDKGESVTLTAFDKEEEAEARHRQGVRRLLAIALAEQLKHVRRALAVDRDLALLQQPAGPLAVLIADIGDRAVERACLPAGDALPRDREAFESALERGRPEVYEIAIRIATGVKNVLQSAREVHGALQSLPRGVHTPIAADCARELKRLAGERFVATTPDPWLSELPRLLAGLGARVAKLKAGTNLAAQQELRAWRERVERLGDRELASELTWLLAEYCVSLFAQRLGTSVPVSAKRLEQRLAAARR